MERQLIFLILVAGIVWLLLDEFMGSKKLISKAVKAVIGK